MSRSSSRDSLIPLNEVEATSPSFDALGEHRIRSLPILHEITIPVGGERYSSFRIYPKVRRFCPFHFHFYSTSTLISVKILDAAKSNSNFDIWNNIELKIIYFRGAENTFALLL